MSRGSFFGGGKAKRAFYFRLSLRGNSASEDARRRLFIGRSLARRLALLKTTHAAQVSRESPSSSRLALFVLSIWNSSAAGDPRLSVSWAVSLCSSLKLKLLELTEHISEAEALREEKTRAQERRLAGELRELQTQLEKTIAERKELAAAVEELLSQREALQRRVALLEQRSSKLGEESEDGKEQDAIEAEAGAGGEDGEGDSVRGSCSAFAKSSTRVREEEQSLLARFEKAQEEARRVVDQVRLAAAARSLCALLLLVSEEF